MTQFLVLSGENEPNVKILGDDVFVTPLSDMREDIKTRAYGLIPAELHDESWMIQGKETSEPIDRYSGRLGYEVLIEERKHLDTTLFTFLKPYIEDKGFKQLTFFYGLNDKALFMFNDLSAFDRYLIENDEYNAFYGRF